MDPVYIQILAFISSCSPVQDRMVGDSNTIYEFNFNSVIRGHHINKSI